MPRKTLEKFLMQVKKGEFLPPNNSKMFKSILNKLEYEIIDTYDLSKTATSIDIKIKNINMEKYMSELNSKMEDLREKQVSESKAKEYINNFFSDLICRRNLEYNDVVITAILKKEDKKWEIENSEEIVSAMMGVGME